jgi:HPt (histidine-containing phosphotransfer) domain-containing protein
MGLFGALLTLPLAPVRGVVWLAEQIETQARREWTDPETVRRLLEEVEQAYQDGQLTEQERDQRQDQLVARLLEDRPAAPDG